MVRRTVMRASVAGASFAETPEPAPDGRWSEAWVRPEAWCGSGRWTGGLAVREQRSLSRARPPRRRRPEALLGTRARRSRPFTEQMAQAVVWQAPLPERCNEGGVRDGQLPEGPLAGRG